MILMFINCGAMWVVDFYLVDKPSNFSLRNLKKTTLYLIMSSFFLWTIFTYVFLHVVYMELLIDLPLLFINDALIVSMDVSYS